MSECEHHLRIWTGDSAEPVSQFRCSLYTFHVDGKNWEHSGWEGGFVNPSFL